MFIHVVDVHISHLLPSHSPSRSFSCLHFRTISSDSHYRPGILRSAGEASLRQHSRVGRVLPPSPRTAPEHVSRYVRTKTRQAFFFMLAGSSTVLFIHCIQTYPHALFSNDRSHSYIFAIHARYAINNHNAWLARYMSTHIHMLTRKSMTHSYESCFLNPHSREFVTSQCFSCVGDLPLAFSCFCFVISRLRIIRVFYCYYTCYTCIS